MDREAWKMRFLLMLPLAIFTVILMLVAGVTAAVEIAERRRLRLRSRRRFRPVVIAGGQEKLAATERQQRAPAGAHPAPIRLVGSAPQ
jgi:hypothetical protein